MSNKNKVVKSETEKNAKPDEITSYVSSISSLGNVLVALSALSYTLGFIVVNAYLATKYSIYNFEILNARYIYSGAAFLLLCALAYFGASFIFSRMEKIHGRSLLQKIFHFIVWFGIAHGAYTAVFISILVVALNREPDAFLSLPSEIPIALWLDLAILIFYVEIFLYRTKGWKSFPNNIPFPSSVFTGVITLALIYGISFYFYLPPSVGGGLPTPITLIVDKSKIEIAQQILPINLQNPSVTVYLIDQNRDSYYVLIGDRLNAASDSLLLPIQVDKSLIVGIIYPNEIKTSKYLDFKNITFPHPPTPTMIPTETSVP
jgi:hypothetical protein